MASKSRRSRKTTELTNTRPNRDEYLWFVLAAAIPLVACANKLNHDLWHDESYTISAFVSQPFRHIATSYPVPNNHVLYSLVLRPFYLISDDDFVLRIPSFLFTLGTLVFTFRLGLRFANMSTAFLSTLALGLNQMFLIFTMQIRGYTLSMFLTAWLADLALRFESPDGPRRHLSLVVIGASLLYTLPTNVFFFVPLATVAIAWTTWRVWRRREVIQEIALWSLALIIALVCYLPILQQVRAAADQTKASLAENVNLAAQFFSAAMRDMWPWLVLPQGLGAALWGWRIFRGPDIAASVEHDGNWRTREISLVILCASGLLGPFLIAGILQTKPYVRNFCPALPILALLQGRLLQEAMQWILKLVPRSPAHRSAAMASVFGGVIFSLVCIPKLVTYPARLSEHREQGLADDGYYFHAAANFSPSQVADFLAKTVDSREPYLVCMTQEVQSHIGYYLSRVGFPYCHFPSVAAERSPARVYVVATKNSDYQELAMKAGLTAETLLALPQMAEFSMFRIFRSSSAIEVRVPDDARPL